MYKIQKIKNQKPQETKWEHRRENRRADRKWRKTQEWLRNNTQKRTGKDKDRKWNYKIKQEINKPNTKTMTDVCQRLPAGRSDVTDAADQHWNLTLQLYCPAEAWKTNHVVQAANLKQNFPCLHQDESSIRIFPHFYMSHSDQMTCGPDENSISIFLGRLFSKLKRFLICREESQIFSSPKVK